ncbi:MAG: alginate export family protein [Candidatus Omnitrophota bacterium]
MKRLLALAAVILSGFCAQTVFASASVGPWSWKIGGDERFRAEYKEDFDFNGSRKDSGNLFLNRIRVNFNALLRDEDFDRVAGIFVEGLDAQAGSYRLKGTASQKDDFDLHQAFLDLYDILDSGFGLKAGRQEMKYGKGRLIWASSWSNRIRHFDGAILQYRRSAFSLDFLYGQDVKFKDGHFNRSHPQEFLAGVYGGYQKGPGFPGLEGYILTQAVTNVSSKAKRYTAGFRAYGALTQGWGFDVEVPYQFGSIGSRTISAYAIHADVSYGRDQAAWKPRLTLEYNEATGDKDPDDGTSGTFIPLYQSTHEPYGIMDFFRWQNMREVALSLEVSPVKKWKFISQVNIFWLESVSDSWVNSSGAVVRSSAGNDADSHVGNEVSLRAEYEAFRNVKFEAGVARFFTGPYVRATGPDDDAGWVYFQVVAKY